MGQLKVDMLKPGMVLMDDVKDINTRLLMKKGQAIAPNHIKILKMWGISEVAIQGVEEKTDPASDTDDPDLLDRIQEDTAYIFQHVDCNHPALSEIFRLAVIYRCHNNIFSVRCDDHARAAFKAESPVTVNLRRKIQQRKIKLPEMPSIVFELNEVISDPAASANDIAQVVDKSPSLTALLLKIVNSSFYGFPAQIDTISRAVAVIGTKEISSLAMGISTITLFKDIPRDVLDMAAFIKHSLATGIIARIIAAHKNMPQTEQLFVSGLLHDLGRLIVYRYYPDIARRLLNQALTDKTQLFDIESGILGCNHVQLGKYLLQKWRLPLSLENNLYYHHEPSKADNQAQAAVVHVADLMVNALGIGSSGNHFVPPFDTEAWEHLDVSPSCFEAVITQATHQLVTLETHLQI
jgi:HD-like signal output (HDOD) protein